MRASLIPETGATRPLLVRSFEHVSELLNPLMADLAQGLTWVSAVGSAPVSGTPTVVRYQVERFGVRLDFGAILEGNYGPGVSKTLVRYDQIPKSKLSAIFGVASLLSAETFTAESGREQGARWCAPQSLDDGPSAVRGRPVSVHAQPSSARKVSRDSASLSSVRSRIHRFVGM
jgi:hypothetical protein